MKKILITLLLALPLMAAAQDNTWERPEVEEVPVQEKEDPNAKYLKGAVTEEDGRVVFTTTIEAPGKSAADIYAIAKQYLQKMISEKNQIQSRLITEDTLAMGIARVGSSDVIVKAGKISELIDYDFTM